MEQRIASIAIPIRTGEDVLGCMNLVYIAEAMTIDEAAAKYLPALERTRDKILLALASSGRGSHPDMP